MRVCNCLRAYARVCVFGRVSACVTLCVCVRARVYVCAHTCVFVFACVCSRVVVSHICVCFRACVYPPEVSPQSLECRPPAVAVAWRHSPHTPPSEGRSSARNKRTHLVELTHQIVWIPCITWFNVISGCTCFKWKHLRKYTSPSS